MVVNHTLLFGVLATPASAARPAAATARSTRRMIACIYFVFAGGYYGGVPVVGRGALVHKRRALEYRFLNLVAKKLPRPVCALLYTSIITSPSTVSQQ